MNPDTLRYPNQRKWYTIEKTLEGLYVARVCRYLDQERRFVVEAETPEDVFDLTLDRMVRWFRVDSHYQTNPSVPSVGKKQ